MGTDRKWSVIPSQENGIWTMENVPYFMGPLTSYFMFPLIS